MAKIYKIQQKQRSPKQYIGYAIKNAAYHGKIFVFAHGDGSIVVNLVCGWLLLCSVVMWWRGDLVVYGFVAVAWCNNMHAICIVIVRHYKIPNEYVVM